MGGSVLVLFFLVLGLPFLRFGEAPPLDSGWSPWVLSVGLAFCLLPLVFFGLQWRRGLVRPVPWDPTLKEVRLLEVPAAAREDSVLLDQVIRDGCAGFGTDKTGKKTTAVTSRGYTLAHTVAETGLTVLFVVRRAG